MSQFYSLNCYFFSLISPATHTQFPSFFLFSFILPLATQQFLFLNLYFSLEIHPDCSLPSPYSSQRPIFPLSQIHSSVSLKKRAGLPRIATKHSITRSNKSAHKPSYQEKAKQPSRRKWVPKAGKRLRDSPTPTYKNTKLHNRNMRNYWFSGISSPYTP